MCILDVIQSLRSAGFGQKLHIRCEAEKFDRRLELVDDPWPHAPASFRYREMLRWALGMTTDSVLAIEDDVEFCVGAAEALSVMEHRTVALASLYTAAKEEEVLQDEGWARWNPGRHAWGPQAILYGRVQLQKFIEATEWPSDEYIPYDSAIFKWYQKNYRRQSYMHSPSLVQHLGTTSLLRSTPHRGLRYDKSYRPGY